MVNQNRLAVNFVWVLVTGYLVTFMQVGFALVETGFCRAKSALHVMMTNFMIYGLGMLAFFLVAAIEATSSPRSAPLACPIMDWNQ